MSILTESSPLLNDLDMIINKVSNDFSNLNNIYNNFFDNSINPIKKTQICINNIPDINMFLSEIAKGKNFIDITKAQELNFKILKKFFTYYNKTLSPFSGLLSLGYSLEGIDSQKSLLDEINNSLKYGVKDFLQKSPKPTLDICENIKGISGISRYLLNHVHNNEMYSLNKQLLSYLINFILEHKNTFNLCTNNKDELKSLINSFDGKIDLGLAHGIAGILSILSISYLKGIKIKGQIDSIKICTNFYMNNLIYRNNTIGWLKKVTLNDIKEIDELPISYVSWCYGSIGISRVLFLSSLVLNDITFKNESLKIVDTNLLNFNEDSQIFSPTFCHGYSGYMYILNLFYKDTKNELYKKKIFELLKKIVNCYNYNIFGGFNNYEMVNKKLVAHNTLNSVDGVISILLSLLSMKQENTTNWDNKFLVN